MFNAHVTRKILALEVIRSRIHREGLISMLIIVVIVVIIMNTQYSQIKNNGQNKSCWRLLYSLIRNLCAALAAAFSITAHSCCASGSDGVISKRTAAHATVPLSRRRRRACCCQSCLNLPRTCDVVRMSHALRRRERVALLKEK